MVLGRGERGRARGESETHKKTGEDLVLPGQVRDTLLIWESGHGIYQREETGTLHGEPGNAAGDVEPAVDRRLAHAIPRHDPLQRGGLQRILISVSLLLLLCRVWVDNDNNDREIQHTYH